MLDGLCEVSAGSESIVYDQWQVMFLGKGCKLLEIRNVQPGVSDGFNIDGLCLLINQFLKIQRIISFCKPGFNAKPFEGDLELVIGSTIHIGAADKIITRL